MTAYYNERDPKAAAWLRELIADGLIAELGLVCLASGEVVTHPLIQKGQARVMRLRGYGNAITVEVARTFIEAYLDTLT